MILPAAVALIFTCFYSVLCSFALSGGQTALRDIGVADHTMAAGVSPGDRATDVQNQAELQQEISASGASAVWTGLRSFDVRPDTIPRPLTTGKSRIINFLEIAGISELFPEGRELVEGGWPTSAGEVAITTELRDRLQSEGSFDGASFTAFSGLVTFRVTGVYIDRFAKSSYGVLAAPGTWAAMPGAKIAQRFTGTGALLSVFWRGDVPESAVAKSLAKRSITPVTPSELLTGLVDRGDYAGSDDVSLTESASFVFTLPFAALTIASMTIGGRGVLAWASTTVGTLVRVGLRRRSLTLLVTLIASLFASLSFVFGSILGVALGWATRTTALPAIAEQPLGPIRNLLPILAFGLVAAFLLVPLALLPLHLPGTGRSRIRGAARAVPWSLLRWILAAVLLIRSIGISAVRDSEADGAGVLLAQLVAVTVLLVPDFVSLLVRVMPSGSAQGLLAKRFMQADRARFALMGMLVAVCIAAPTATSIFVATTTRTESAGNVSQVPPGQLWVDRSEGVPAASASLAVAKDVGSEPVAVGGTLAYTEGDPGSPTSTQTGINTVDSTDDLGRLLGTAMKARYATTLENGGAVVFGSTAKGRSIQFQNGTDTPRDIPVRIEAVAGASAEIQGAAGGFVLTGTARELGLEVVPILDVYSGLTDEEIQTAVDAVRKTGRDTHSLQYHVIPEPTKPTRDWYTAVVGLLSVGAVVLAALMASHAGNLREYGTRLSSLGILRRWTRAVGFRELVVTLSGATVAAVLASVSAISVLVSTSQTRLILDIPWAFIALTVSSTLALCVAVFVAALRPSSRPTR